MTLFPDKISSEQELEEILSRPTKDLIKTISRLDGDMLFLGVAGKIGISMAIMAKRAVDSSGTKKRVIGLSRFSQENQKKLLEKEGIEIIEGDLLNPEFVKELPKIKNIIFLAGMKFGSEENLSLTWAINAYLPGLIIDHFTESRIVAFSTGCVYPLVPVSYGGSREVDKPDPVGEYAQSCLGRERIFEYGSLRYGTPVILIRLNYAVEMRYGVLVDIALKVKTRKPIKLTMGHFNAIWQGDANAMILQALNYCESPARILNITGQEILSVKDVAIRFGKLLGIEPEFTGKKSETALLSNAEESFKLIGYPGVNVENMISWIADWIANDRPLLNKPTHFEVRDGKY
jgi:nucleoside-diphosphate-sugar epimerase